MLGTFLEGIADAHVRLRSALLGRDGLDAPRVPTLQVRSDTLVADGPPVVEASLRSHGLSIVQLDEPLDTAGFMAFGRRLGSLVPELDPSVQPHVDHGVVLNVRTSLGPTRNVAQQPFAANFLTLHTEGSGNAIDDQPRYVALMCVDPGEPADAPKTVIVPMHDVLERLSAQTREILGRTRYHNDRGSPPILRREDERWVLCFRDFHHQSLAWAYEGGRGEPRIDDALRELLASMYDPRGASAIAWRQGLLVVIDNRRLLHGRSEGSFVPTRSPRHLVRLRICASTPAMSRGRVGLPSADAPVLSLFSAPVPTRRPPSTIGVLAGHVPAVDEVHDVPFVDERTLDVFARANNPEDPFELHDLWLGRVEAELGPYALRSRLAERWRATRPLRTVSEEEVLRSRATGRMVKELFNTFFRDDLYGALRSDENLILSSGSVDEAAYGLPSALKETIRFALDRDWYGYSDSRGREPARSAVAAYESARMSGAPYCADHVVLTMGATHAISSIADFVLGGRPRPAPVLCGIPNYPPLVEALARRHPTRLVPTPSRDGVTSLDALRCALEPDTPLVLLQTAANPSGSLVDEVELGRFIEATSPSTIVVLDECHEWLGAPRRFSRARARSNVVRVSSLSKEWSAPGLKVGWFVADPAFVAGYYEHASTSYGGPPSFMYTLVEVLARLERWRIEGRSSVAAAQVREFEASYGLCVTGLADAYRSYKAERQAREEVLYATREQVVAGLRRSGARVVPPRCSINLVASMPGHDDSYRCFRELLRNTGVSVYPSLLAFHLAGGWVRVTSARTWSELGPALDRLQQRGVDARDPQRPAAAVSTSA